MPALKPILSWLIITAVFILFAVISGKKIKNAKRCGRGAWFGSFSSVAEGLAPQLPPPLACGP